MEKIRSFAIALVVVMVAGCAAENDDTSAAAAAGSGTGGEQQLGGLGGAGDLGTGGEQLGGVGGAGVGGERGVEAPPTIACGVDQEVAGTACSTNGYVYLPGDHDHWCVVCYDWPPPSPNFVPNYRSGCLAPLASDPSITVQCVTSCAPCAPCARGEVCK